MDSAANNGTLIRALESYFKENNISYTENSQVRCFLHICNLAAQDFLSSIKCDAPLEEENEGEDVYSLTDEQVDSYISSSPIKKVNKFFFLYYVNNNINNNNFF